MRLALSFIRTPGVELFEVYFENSGQSRLARRGKGLVFRDEDATFQWTVAVKAFAALAVGSRLAIAHQDQEPFKISGGKGSQAASLDYAIGKPTAWISGLFGSRESKSRSAPRHLFRISNTERKLPGPVEIHLTSALLSPDALQIVLDGAEVTDPTELKGLLATLEEGRPPRSSAPIPWYRSSGLKDKLHDNSVTSLREVVLLEPTAISDATKRLRRYPWFQRSSKASSICKQLLKNIPPLHLRYSPVVPKQLGRTRARPLRIACLPMAVGTIVLLRYVSRIASRPIELHLDYPSSSSIVAHSENSNFDYIILSWGAALQLPRALRASAVMLLPRTEIELVTRHPAPKSIKTVVLANDKRGYPWQFFDALKKGGLPALRKTTLVDASLSEIPTALRSGATAAIVAAPFSSVLGTQLPVQVVKLTTDCGRLADNILFQPNSNRKAAETAAQFSRLIRSAWFELLENPERIKTEVTSLSADRAYQSTLSRLSGTLRFSAAT